LPPQSFGFFRAIWKWVLEAELGLIVLARISGRAVAGAVFFHYGKKVIYKFAASDMRYQSLRPGNLVMWEGVKWFAGKGFAVLDLGRTAIGQEGLRRFKLGFGSEEYAGPFGGGRGGGGGAVGTGFSIAADMGLTYGRTRALPSHGVGHSE
jgi:CelD/BcsL family acetyltransferase involved in cellulose biosynthesis